MVTAARVVVVVGTAVVVVLVVVVEDEVEVQEATTRETGVLVTIKEVRTVVMGMRRVLQEY